MRGGDDVACRCDAVLKRHCAAFCTNEERIRVITGRWRKIPEPRHGRIGGWNDSAVSQGKWIQVSCDTSVMKVSTSGLPCGLA